jgi:glycerol-1-phosphate dehydrogenase [NAD(P)+]
VVETLSQARGEPLVYLAVGSGTITDITRYASYSSRNPFIALPTAPSVDAYTTSGAALLMAGVKVTLPSHSPMAVFADLNTLCEAPSELVAAGFGDIVGKYTSLADWKLGAMLLKERYDAEVAGRLRQSVQVCVSHREGIRRASPDAIQVLMETLFESGLCMAQFGTSRPASGAEHALSHFWEAKLRLQGRPAVLHGAKVGVGTVLAARRYDAVRRLTRAEIADRLSAARPPDEAGELERVRGAYGPLADQVIANYQPFMTKVGSSLETIGSTIMTRWADFQDILTSVPPAEEIEQLLEEAGAPCCASALGLDEAEVQEALEFCHYLRARFTIHTLARLLAV